MSNTTLCRTWKNAVLNEHGVFLKNMLTFECAKENRYKALRKSINKDPAKSASTMLYLYKRNLDELCFERHFLCQIGALEQYLSDYLADAFEQDIGQVLHDRMQQRIKWQAGLIDETIETRKNKGTYKGEFTTAVILANAYNDIFHYQYKEFK